MNYIWTTILIFCFIFSTITNNFTYLINSLFDVPEESLKLLISIGGLIIIYNGIFQIAIDSKLIKYISYIFKPFISKLYKTKDPELIELLSAIFTANLLGLGIASTPIAIKIIQKFNNKKNIFKLICMNISCFTLFPFTIMSLRNKFNGINNFKICIFIIIITFLTTLFGLFLAEKSEKK